MSKDHYVVTNPELGWDCVIGLYLAKSAKDVYEYLAESYDMSIEECEDKFIVTEQSPYEI
jgi:arginine utilization protein RocB